MPLQEDGGGGERARSLPLPDQARSVLPHRAPGSWLAPWASGFRYTFRPRVRFQSAWVGRPGCRLLPNQGEIQVVHACQSCFLVFYPIWGLASTMYLLILPQSETISVPFYQWQGELYPQHLAILLQLSAPCFQHPRIHLLFVRPGSALQIQRRCAEPSYGNLTDGCLFLFSDCYAGGRHSLESPGDRSAVFLKQVQYRQQQNKSPLLCRAFTFTRRMPLGGGGPVGAWPFSCGC